MSIALFLAASSPPASEFWSGIIDPARATDWTGAGVQGGIPTTYTKDGATVDAYSGTATTINNRLAAAGNNTYVELGAGTFTLSTGIRCQNSNTILRGQGAGTTIIEFTGPVAPFGQDCTMSIDNGSYMEQSAPSNEANWTSGYAQGTTDIVIASVANLSIGHVIWLLQDNDASPPADDVGIGSETGVWCNGNYGGGGEVGVAECVELHIVTAINGTTVTIDPPIRMPNYRSGQNPKVWYKSGAPVNYVGIEDMTILHADAGSDWGIQFVTAKNCWVKGVKSTWSPRCHVRFWQVSHCEVRGCHLFEGQSHSSQSYGVELMDASDCLVENNVVIRVTAPFIATGSCSGTVVANNYSNLNTYSVAAWMQPSSYFHATGGGYALHEGNISNGIISDNVHGPICFITAFRNQYEGWETGKSAQTVPVNIYSYSRFFNLVGNVLGRHGYHDGYECFAGGSPNLEAIYALGFGGNISDGGSGDNPDNDTYVRSSVMRWGNWDTFTSSDESSSNDATGTRWESSEVPSSITDYPNEIPSSQTLPASFFRSEKPAWWGSISWPCIGPDVTGGDISNKGGHAYANPALAYYNAATKDGQGEMTDFDSDME